VEVGGGTALPTAVTSIETPIHDGRKAREPWRDGVANV